MPNTDPSRFACLRYRPSDTVVQYCLAIGMPDRDAMSSCPQSRTRSRMRLIKQDLDKETGNKEDLFARHDEKSCRN